MSEAVCTIGGGEAEARTNFGSLRELYYSVSESGSSDTSASAPQPLGGYYAGKTLLYAGVESPKCSWFKGDASADNVGSYFDGTVTDSTDLRDFYVNMQKAQGYTVL